MNFKRIILTSKPSIKAIESCNLIIFDSNVYTVITREGLVQEILKRIQDAGYRGLFIVVDEKQFAAGNGSIYQDIIVGGGQ